MASLRDSANIGRRLRELRLERGLQQADVARTLGVSGAYLNLLEKGKRTVQLPLLWKALSFFGMFATFDTPFEVTTSELAMELLFPADQATAESLGPRSNQGGAG